MSSVSPRTLQVEICNSRSSTDRARNNLEHVGLFILLSLFTGSIELFHAKRLSKGMD
jgi:hypothetical protein